MTSLALKKKIYSKLKSTTKVNLLKDVYRLLEMDDSVNEPLVLTETQLKKVKIAKKQMAEGKVKSHKQATQEIDKWLGK